MRLRVVLIFLRLPDYSFFFVSNLVFITFSVCLEISLLLRIKVCYAVLIIFSHLFVHVPCSLPFSDKHIYSLPILNLLSFEILARSF